MGTVSKVSKAMVLAAGEGTRLSPLTLETPKVLLPVGAVPLVCRTLAWLKSHGISQVAINLYHLGNKIREFLGNGSWFGVEISYSWEETLLGTAGGVKKMAHFFSNTFVVVYGDVLTDFDLAAMISFHQEKKALVTLALFEAPEPSEVGVVQLDKDGRVLDFVEKPPKEADLGNLGSGGVYVLERQVLDYIPNQGFCDFAYDIFPKLIQAGLPIYGYVLDSQDYLIDIGTPEKCCQANKDVEAGRLRICYGKRAVFLDRDGTIARDVHYCRRVEDFELLPTVPEAIRLLNENGFKVVVITNQSGIARGYFTEETLKQIHQKLKDELAKHGVWVDAIYYCPHHPDDGCDCRKPKTALFHRAARELNIDFTGSYVIGDLPMDIEAGKALGCKTVLVTTGPEPPLSNPQSLKSRPGTLNLEHRAPDYIADSLMEAVKWIVRQP